MFRYRRAKLCLESQESCLKNHLCRFHTSVPMLSLIHPSSARSGAWDRVMCLYHEQFAITYLCLVFITDRSQASRVAVVYFIFIRDWRFSGRRVIGRSAGTASAASAGAAGRVGTLESSTEFRSEISGTATLLKSLGYWGITSSGGWNWQRKV